MDRSQFNSLNSDSFMRIASSYDTIYLRPDTFSNNDNHFTMHYIKECPDPSGNKVLEVGCGTGDFSVYLSNFGYNVTGIDLSDNMLLVARNKLSILKKSISQRKELMKNPDFMMDPNAKILLSTVEPKLKFIKDNILKINTINEKYNIVSALDLISYIHPDDFSSFIAEISNLIYKTGIAVFSFKTENYFKYNTDTKFEDSLFNCIFKHSFDLDTKYYHTACEFQKSPAVKKPFSINFTEYLYSINTLIKVLSDKGMNVIKIFPNQQIFSNNDCDTNSICDAIESTYSMPNGIKNVILIAQKLT